MATGTAAERAYRAAVELIGKTKAEGGKQISFYEERLNALDCIPPEIAGVEGLWLINLEKTQIAETGPLSSIASLQELDLNTTRVSDITPLAGLSLLRQLELDRTWVTDLSPIADLTALQTLSLDQTGVTDLSPLTPLTALQNLWLDQTHVTDVAPLAGLTALQTLSLIQTGVTDLAPLAGLTALRTLRLSKTGVSDLRQIRDLPKLGDNSAAGLWFSDTPATALDPELARLSGIENNQERTAKTLAYLKTLPPWPEPLPWLDPPEPDAPIEIPGAVSAPLQVAVQDGVLRPVRPGDGLDAQGHLMARQGWEALRDYLADLADLRPRIVNQMPNLARALTRFEAALGAKFDSLNPIALGTHGQRVTRLAGAAGETMSDADAADLREFAAAVTLFLERFPEWRAYREAAQARPLDAAAVQRTLPAIGEIEDELLDRVGIDPDIPRVLRDLRRSAEDAPEDKVAGRGLVDSAGNLLSGLAHVLWQGIKATGRGAGWFIKEVAKKGAEKVAEKLVDYVSSPAFWAAVDIFVNKARVLKAIASAYPEQFDWLMRLLQLLGLG